MAQRVSQVPGVEMVRGITRPTGESLEQARATYQAGEVGSKLGDASKQITDHNDDLNMLTGGADQLADALGDVRGQVGQAIGTVGVLVDALSSMQHQVGGEKTLKDIDNAAQLITSMHGLGDAIGVNFANFTDSFDWVGPVLQGLDASPVCNADPSCVDSRECSCSAWSPRATTEPSTRSPIWVASCSRRSHPEPRLDGDGSAKCAQHRHQRTAVVGGRLAEPSGHPATWR